VNFLLAISIVLKKTHHHSDGMCQLLKANLSCGCNSNLNFSLFDNRAHWNINLLLASFSNLKLAENMSDSRNKKYFIFCAYDEKNYSYN